jgi:cell division protein FtsB
MKNFITEMKNKLLNALHESQTNFVHLKIDKEDYWKVLETAEKLQQENEVLREIANRVFELKLHPADVKDALEQADKIRGEVL